jgi:hypothetical protein
MAQFGITKGTTTITIGPLNRKVNLGSLQKRYQSFYGFSNVAVRFLFPRFGLRRMRWRVRKVLANYAGRYLMEIPSFRWN